jgi:hypothetical protein
MSRSSPSRWRRPTSPGTSIECLELTGANGGPIESGVGVAMTEFSDEELERIIAAGQTIDEPLALASGHRQAPITNRR